MHSHPHVGHPNTGTVLAWSLIATVAFVVAEIVAGIRAQSLALLSDAGHNFTDALALLLASFAFYFAGKPADDTKTYGYHRAGVLAAFVNALTLLGLAAFVLYESVERFRHPREVDEAIMLYMAGAGLVVNLAIMFGLRRERGRDINVRAAFVHMLGDALGSVGIIIGAVAIRYTGLDVIDAILSMLIAVLIIWTAWDIVKESLNILLEGLPRGMKLEDVVAVIRAQPGVLDVHDVHVWSLGSSTHALSCHVLIDDMPPSESQGILGRINAALCERFGIRHTTLQFEHADCVIAENGCCLPAKEVHQH